MPLDIYGRAPDRSEPELHSIIHHLSSRILLVEGLSYQTQSLITTNTHYYPFLNKEKSFNKQAIMGTAGKPAAIRKLPLKKRVVTIFGEGEDDDGAKKPAARPSPEAGAEFDESSSPEARDQLEQALELIPYEEKAAYLEAVETAHHLIEDESNPVWFIRYEQCNFWAAASRLVTYWKERKAMFGDRAFRPLKLLTG
jgi:hypothetical protein